jgi:hypothetical protein
MPGNLQQLIESLQPSSMETLSSIEAIQLLFNLTDTYVKYCGGTEDQLRDTLTTKDELIELLTQNASISADHLASFRDGVRTRLYAASNNLLTHAGNDAEERYIVEQLYRFNSYMSQISYAIDAQHVNFDEFFKKNNLSVSELQITDLECILSKSTFNELEPSRFTKVEFDKKYSYLVYEYPVNYLKEVRQADYIDVCNLFKWVENIVSGKIESLGYSNFRIEHFWHYETINQDDKETVNLNNTWHRDGDLEGAIKALIYLTHVDSTNGPFGYELEGSPPRRVLLHGKKGTTVIFKPNKVTHCAANTLSAKRLTLSFTTYPYIASKNKCASNNAKPFNSLCSKNPFF